MGVFLLFHIKMKKVALVVLLLTVFNGLTSFGIHKFYVSIYQINHNVPKKRLEVTTRIFIDDLNKVLSKHYDKKTNICEPLESVKDIEFLKLYLSEKIIIKINGKAKPLVFKYKELETNVVVCYFVCNDVSKIKSFEIENSAMLSLNAEQQNIVHTKINNQKKTLLLTASTFTEKLNF